MPFYGEYEREKESGRWWFLEDVGNLGGSVKDYY